MKFKWTVFLKMLALRISVSSFFFDIRLEISGIARSIYKTASIFRKPLAEYFMIIVEYQVLFRA